MLSRAQMKSAIGMGLNPAAAAGFWRAPELDLSPEVPRKIDFRWLFASRFPDSRIPANSRVLLNDIFEKNTRTG